MNQHKKFTSKKIIMSVPGQNGKVVIFMKLKKGFMTLVPPKMTILLLWNLAMR